MMEYKAINTEIIPGYNVNNRYAISHVIGGCMDSADSPIRVGDGADVLGHWINKYEFLIDWEQYQGRVIVAFFIPGIPQFPHPLVKQFIRVDYGLFMVLRMYEPLKEFSVPVDYLKEDILIVDTVI